MSKHRHVCWRLSWVRLSRYMNSRKAAYFEISGTYRMREEIHSSATSSPSENTCHWGLSTIPTNFNIHMCSGNIRFCTRGSRKLTNDQCSIPAPTLRILRAQRQHLKDGFPWSPSWLEWRYRLPCASAPGCFKLEIYMGVSCNVISRLASSINRWHISSPPLVRYCTQQGICNSTEAKKRESYGSS